MKKTCLSVLTSLFFFCMTVMSMAQQQLLTLHDLIPGGETYHRYLPENLYGLQWWEEKCIVPGMDSVCAVTPATGAEEVIALREEVNNRLTAKNLGTIPHFYDIRFSPSSKDEFYFKVTRGDTLHHVFYNFLRKEIVKVISSGRGHAKLAPSGGVVAYTSSGTLWYSTERVSDVMVAEGAEGVLNGESVHRNEFGIHKGIFWSPQGNKLAFYWMDERMVTEYPLVDISIRIASLQSIRYPMAGMTSHQVLIGIYDPENNRTIYLETGDPTDRYFTNIAWSPDERYIYLIELNRGQDHAKLCRYEAGSGKLDRVLLEERHEKYVEPQHPVTFLPWDNELFIYQSQRDGYNHLYLYNTEGELIRQLTRGEWIVKNLVGFDEKKKEVLYTSTEYSPLQENLFRISVKGGRGRLVGNNKDIHTVTPNPSGRYVIDRYSAPGTPRHIAVIDTYTGKENRLLAAADPYRGHEMPEIVTGTIRAADGVTDLYYRMVKPLDFDPSRKYPVVVYVYGGPHAQVVNNGWMHGARGWDIYMA